MISKLTEIWFFQHGIAFPKENAAMNPSSKTVNSGSVLSSNIVDPTEIQIVDWIRRHPEIWTVVLLLEVN